MSWSLLQTIVSTTPFCALMIVGCEPVVMVEPPDPTVKVPWASPPLMVA
jgi:hypothetical protein